MMTFKHLFLQAALIILITHALPSAAHNKTKNGTTSHSHSHSPPAHNHSCNYSGAFKQVFAFGDSNTDSGNALLMGTLINKMNPQIHTSGNPFCDGSLLIDFVCDALSIPPIQPYQNSSGNFINGANFAVAGTSCLPSGSLISTTIQTLLGKVIPAAINLQISWFQKYMQAMVASSGSQVQGGGSHGNTGSGNVQGGASFTAGGGGGGSGDSSGKGSGGFGFGGGVGGTGSGGSGSTSHSSGGGSGFSSGSSGGSFSSGSAGGGGIVGGGSSSSFSSGGSSSGSLSSSGSGSYGGSIHGGAGGTTAGGGGISGGASSTSATGAAVSKALDDALFWVGPIGGNDYARMHSTQNSGVSSQWITQQNINQVSKLVTTLLETGAKYIVVQGLPPVGCFPVTLASTPSSDKDQHGCSASTNAAVTSHNDELQQFLALIQKTFVDSTIVYADFFKAYMTVITSPEMYHIVEAFSACCGLQGGALNFDPQHPCGAIVTTKCQKAAAYVMWDGIHLTQQMNKYMVQMFLNQQGFTQPSLQDVVNKKMAS